MPAPKILVRECPDCRLLCMTSDATGETPCDSCAANRAKTAPTQAPPAENSTETPPVDASHFTWNVMSGEDGKGSTATLNDPHDTES